ncbi:MAG: hypothetical protein P9F19_16875 [Candidatus Contendobacter sp.]|nr:hypothetical protein [Candidatus Contendobacter sp.]
MTMNHTPPTAESGFPPVTEVACHLFFDFRHEPGPTPAALPTLNALESIPVTGTAGATAIRLIDPTRLVADHPRPIGERPVWEERSLTLSNDLHPFIRTMLDCADPPSDAAPAADPPIRCRGLSSNGKNLINGHYRRPSPTGPDAKGAAARPGRAANGLEVVLGATAKARLQAASEGVDPPDALPILIEDIQLFRFRTGITLAVVDVSFPPTQTPWDRAPEKLLETLPLLSRHTGAGLLRWRDSPTDAKSGERFLPGDLVRGVLGGAVLPGERPPRVYSHVAAVFETSMPPVQARELAFRLSRHYTGAYRVGAALEGTVLTEPFEDIVHAASLEGAASVINGYATAREGERELLKNWLTDRYRQVYLPLQIVAIHERVALLDMAQNAAIDVGAMDVTAEATTLRALCNRFLTFRLRYRAVQVSHITMHNQVHQATRAALDLDRMIEKVAHDVMEAERWLSDVAREEAAAKERVWERRYAWFAGLGGSGLTFLTVTAAAKAIADFWDKSKDLSEFGKPTVIILGVGLILAFALATVGFWYSWRRTRAGHHELGHQAEHAGNKVIIKSHG